MAGGATPYLVLMHEITRLHAAERSVSQKRGHQRTMKLRALFFLAGKLGGNAKSFVRKLLFQRRTPSEEDVGRADKSEEDRDFIGGTPWSEKSKFPSKEHLPNIELHTLARATTSPNAVSDMNFTACNRCSKP